MAVISLLLLFGFSLFGNSVSDEAMPIVQNICIALTMLSAAWFTCKLFDVFFWAGVVEKRLGQPPSRLLVDVTRLLIVLAFVLTFVWTRFGTAPLTELLVSSGVVGVVLGFALQRMISDFFSGSALNVEHPFHIGDWIEVNGLAGKVVEVNWRATHVVTIENILVVMPNSFIAERRITNYNHPAMPFRTEFPVSLEYSVPVHDAKRVLMAALLDAPGVLADPGPDVILKEFGNDGVGYRCRFYLNSYADINTVPDIVATHISEHLWQAGMSVPYPKRDVYHTK